MYPQPPPTQEYLEWQQQYIEKLKKQKKKPD